MLNVILWKWGHKYDASYVNRMSSMLSRHLHIPYRIYCITDDPADIEVQCLPLPALPHYITSTVNLRRLWLFSEAAHEVFPGRILQLDLDMIITSDITPLAINPSPFIIWRYIAPTVMGFALNPSVMLMDTGLFSHHWTDFLADPKHAYQLSRRARCSGSDQSIITHWFTAPIPGQFTRATLVPTWSNMDGIYWSRELQTITPGEPGRLPFNARIISFHGRRDPRQQAASWPWINEHWR